MKNLISLILACMLLSGFYSCQKKNLSNDYKDFLAGHEITYTGAVGKVTTAPGNLEIQLKWKSSTDPSIVKYVVYYNSKADSQVVNITAKTDSVSTIIKNLKEYVYSFTIYSYDAKGNKSIPTEVNNARVYGPIYAAALLNRGYDASNPYVFSSATTVRLNFIKPDTINIKTVIRYINTSGATVDKNLSPDSSGIVLTDFKKGTDVLYKSYYIPERKAIDVFEVSAFSTFPQLAAPTFYTLCDKSLFKSVSLPNDVYADFGTSFEKMWDGSVGPQSYPNIFHSNNVSLPQTFTIDLGKTYTNLGRLEETGRDQSHNPLTFEVWGIASLTNASNTVPPTNAGWKDEAIAKGWVLLKDCVRTDDGKQAVKFDLKDSPPPVRYIRLRIKTNVSGEAYTNISELTFWDRQ